MADKKPNPCIVKWILFTWYLNSPPFGRANNIYVQLYLCDKQNAVDLFSCSEKLGANAMILISDSSYINIVIAIIHVIYTYCSSTHMTPEGLVMAGCCQINYI